MRLRPAAFAMLAACLAVPAAFAQSSAPASASTSVAPAEQRQPLDANHDGFITRDEAQSHPGIARNFDKIDTNHDGKIDREEFRAWRQQRKGRDEQQSAAPPSAASSTGAASATPDKQRQPLDANHDGFITREEAQSHPGIARNFDKIDTNHDGKIDREEYRAWHQQVQSRREQKQESQPDAPEAASSAG